MGTVVEGTIQPAKLADINTSAFHEDVGTIQKRYVLREEHLFDLSYDVDIIKLIDVLQDFHTEHPTAKVRAETSWFGDSCEVELVASWEALESDADAINRVKLGQLAQVNEFQRARAEYERLKEIVERGQS